MILLMLVLLSIAAHAERNPSAVYCEELGYQYEIEKTSHGDKGICIMPDGSRIEAWAFLQGKDGQQFNYCTQNGLEYKILTDKSECNSIYTRDCIVCLVDGKDVEMTLLMDLDFSESPCGDGICNSDESVHTCSEDCPEQEVQCVYDGICLDVCKGTDDIDCICIDSASKECKRALDIKEESNLIIYILLSGFIALLMILILIVRKTKRVLN